MHGKCFFWKTCFHYNGGSNLAEAKFAIMCFYHSIRIITVVKRTNLREPTTSELNDFVYIFVICCSIYKELNDYQLSTRIPTHDMTILTTVADQLTTVGAVTHSISWLC